MKGYWVLRTQWSDGPGFYVAKRQTGSSACRTMTNQLEKAERFENQLDAALVRDLFEGCYFIPSGASHTAL